MSFPARVTRCWPRSMIRSSTWYRVAGLVAAGVLFSIPGAILRVGDVLRGFVRPIYAGTRHGALPASRRTHPARQAGWVRVQPSLAVHGRYARLLLAAMHRGEQR